jgi:hypothetical protein
MMLKPLKSVSPRLSREAKRLIDWCIALDQSGSRLEDQFWEVKIVEVLEKILKTGKEKPLETALEHLSEHHHGGFEALIELAENLSSSCIIEVDGKRWQVLLVSAPAVCWTRYQIPSHVLSAAQIQDLSLAMHAHVLASGTTMAVLPRLISLDQMSQSFSETFNWTQQLAHMAVIQEGTLPTLHDEPDFIGMLADSRHIVIAVAAPLAAPIFRWQETPEERREKCATKWSNAITGTLAPSLAGCEFEPVLPDAYYVNLREADKRVRPLTIKAAVKWLSEAMKKAPQAFRVVIAGFGEDRVEEYRLSITEKGQNAVLYGIVWPMFMFEDLLSAEFDDNKLDTVEKMVAILHENGITDIRRLPTLLALEFCEDCGAPQFPNPMGELVHAELPDDIDDTPIRFH